MNLVTRVQVSVEPQSAFKLEFCVSIDNIAIFDPFHIMSRLTGIPIGLKGVKLERVGSMVKWLGHWTLNPIIKALAHPPYGKVLLRLDPVRQIKVLQCSIACVLFRAYFKFLEV